MSALGRETFVHLRVGGSAEERGSLERRDLYPKLGAPRRRYKTIPSSFRLTGGLMSVTTRHGAQACQRGLKRLSFSG